MSNSKIYDAVWDSIDELNEINTEFIANKTGVKEEDICEILNTSDNFVLVPKETQNGIQKCWLPVSHYIGGNLSKKLKETEIANSNGEFDKAIKMLKESLPKSFDLLNNTPGMSILTIDYINDFITHLNGKKIELSRWEHVIYNPFSDKFCVNIKHRCSQLKLSYANMNNKWGTADKSAVDLIYEILNGIPTVVYDIGHNVNQKKTELANAKRDAIQEEFKRWLICDSKRRKSVEKLIIDTIAGYKKSNISGDYLIFPELNENFKFHDYQKDAIAFALHKKNTLLAMNVGSGKTATIYGIIMKRNQIFKNHGKNVSQMIVVANSTLLQFKEQIMLAHPDSNICVVQPKNFTPSKRNSVLKEIKENGANYRNQLRTLISVAVLSNAFRKADIKLAKYRGFDIIAPKSTGDIAKDKKLLIKGTGTYIVEIESEAGSLTKIDNIIDSFPDRIEKVRNAIATTSENIQSIQTQLSTFSVASYDKRIEELEKEFDALKASINM